jgi:hypothetical protein
MAEEIRAAKVGPVVDLVFLGEVHIEAGRLIVGDVDVVRRFQVAYGGHRQLGELHVVLHLLTAPTVEVSPSGDGVFVEHSEPAD